MVKLFLNIFRLLFIFKSRLPEYVSRIIVIYTHAIVMLVFFVGSLAAGMKSLYVLMMGKTSLAMALMLWHHAIYCRGALRFCNIAQALPFLALSRISLKPSRWWIWLSELASPNKGRLPLPSVLGTELLVRRDGHTIFDFFKTLVFSGISPPVLVSI